jgi:ribosome-associated protein
VTATEQSIVLAREAAQAAADKLAHDVLILDVSDRLALTDCFVLATADNERQVRAVTEEVERRLRDLGVKPVRREGETAARWVLLDFADIVVHVQHVEERDYYGLERLWKDCPRVSFTDRDAAGRGLDGRGLDGPGVARSGVARSGVDDVDRPVAGVASGVHPASPARR